MVEVTPAALPAANDPVAAAAAAALIAAPATPVVAPVVAPIVDPVVAPIAAPIAAPVKPGDGTADPVAPTGAPEAYAAFTLPEGMEMNVTALEKFAPLAKELNLSQEQAQKLVTMDAGRQSVAKQTWETEQQNTVADMMDEWRETTKADPTVGGANLDTSLAQVRVFLNKFASPALLELLDTTGVGNHVEVIRLFAAVGKAMGEDGVSSGGLKPVDKRLPEQILYPNQEV